MIAGYYVLVSWFQYEELWSDITLFVISAFVAQYVGWLCAAYFVPTLSKRILATFTLLVIGFFHMCFTVAPPKWQFIFRDPEGFYGVPDECHPLRFPSFSNKTQSQ